MFGPDSDVYWCVFTITKCFHVLLVIDGNDVKFGTDWSQTRKVRPGPGPGPGPPASCRRISADLTVSDGNWTKVVIDTHQIRCLWSGTALPGLTAGHVTEGLFRFRFILHEQRTNPELKLTLRRSFMMSAAPSSVESRLEVLECHFTWALDPNGPYLFSLRDKLTDIGTEEGNVWLGHIYNLQGYVHHQLGLVQDARQFFTRAEETFRQTRTSGSDEGPWLVVNYGNQAWLYHHQGDQAQSESYLSKVDALNTKHPCPSQDLLHPEVGAEKAWTLMKFSKDKKLLAVDLFEEAIMVQPDRAEWCTSQVLALASAHKHSNTALDDDILDKMKTAKEQDPENLYLAVLYLSQCSKKGDDVKDEARELAAKILGNPVGSYSGIKAILRLYRRCASDDEAIDLAEEALRKHPDNRYLKRCAALSYKWKIMFQKDSAVGQSTIDRGVGLLTEVIGLYPDSSLVKELDLANVYAQSNHSVFEADRIYKNLLQNVGSLGPADRQMLYNQYAKYLYFDREQNGKSITYLMKAAQIPHESFYRQNSIKILEKIRGRCRNRRCTEIGEFLERLQEPEFQH